MGKKRKVAVGEKSAVEIQRQRIVVLGVAAKEGWEELTPGQYQHLKDLIKQLVDFGSRKYESNLTIAQFGDFWELKEKGGTLGRKNMRVYFRHDKEANAVVVLHTYKKEDDGQAPRHIRIRLKNRWRCYLNGDFDKNLIRYKPS